MGKPPDDAAPAGKLRVVTDDYQHPRAKKTRKPPSYRRRWIEQVCRSPQITDAVKVMLLTVADSDRKWMDDDGRLEVTQAKVAAAIGKPVRRVYDRYKAAIDAGFLEEVAKGGQGKPVAYVAVIPVYDAAAKAKRRGNTSNLSA